MSTPALRSSNPNRFYHHPPKPVKIQLAYKSVALKDLPIGLTYDDVLLVPRRSTVRSRSLADLKCQLSRNLTLDIPVVAANMDTVCEAPMAITLAQLGGIGIIHRFLPVHVHAQEIEKVKAADASLLVGAAVGADDEDRKRRAKECVAAGTDVLVFDIAHGHSDHAIAAISELKTDHPEVEIIAGNVATAQGAIDLVEAGADAIKVGVGPGGVCTTRLVAGVGVPQLTAVADVVETDVGVPIMADGGIRTAGDIAKALAAGADTVMIGSLFAGTKESPGEVESTPSGLMKRVRGMASYEASVMRAERHGEEFNEEYFEHRAPEGVERRVTYRGEVSKLVNQLMGGLKSSMSYLDADNFTTFRENASFIRVTPAGLREGHPHATDDF